MSNAKVKNCAVCGEALNSGDVDSIECPKCHTVYDLVNRKVDNSKTTIAPLDCKHRKRLLVQGSSGSGQNEDVTVCADCGEIHITGRTTEHREYFHVRTVVWSQELVNAIGKAARLISDQPGFPES